MPWKVCKPMDERLKFVARLLDGEKMAVADIQARRDILAAELRALYPPFVVRLNETLIVRDLKLPHWNSADGFAWPPLRLALPFKLSGLEESQIRRTKFANARVTSRQKWSASWRRSSWFWPCRDGEK